MGVGLRSRIVIPCASIVTVTVVTVSALAAYRIQSVLVEKSYETYQTLTDQLCESSYPAAEQRRASDLPAHIHSLTEQEEMQWLAIYGSDRRCLFFWKRPGAPEIFEADTNWQGMFPVDTQVVARSHPNMAETIEFLAPIRMLQSTNENGGEESAADVLPRKKARGAAVGAVRLGITGEQARQQARLIADDVVRTAVLVATIGIVLTYFLSRRMAKPVYDLIRQTASIGAGNFDGRVPIPRTKEFAKLAQAFNRMGDRLRHYSEQIENQNQILERRVEERTTELVQAMEELKRLDKLKDEFLSNVSHELRTPLTSIRAFAEILQDSDDDPEARAEFLNIMVSECQRLSRLIENVLDLSKIESGTLNWNFQVVDIAPGVEDVVQAARAVETDKHVHFEAEEGIPSTGGDEDRLKQVWTNLINNATKFTEGGKHIWVKVLTEEDSIVVEIRDQGIGIRKEDQPAVFERFRQVGADIMTEKSSGTGLGLSISKQIVERHHGRIELESEIGVGTTFRVVLPIQSAEELEAIRPIPASEAAQLLA